MKRFLKAFVLFFIVAWPLLVLLSWLLSAIVPDVSPSGTPHIQSLLSGHGLRWFFSNLVSGLASPLLVWLLLAAMAAGCLMRSSLLRFPSSPTKRHVRALRLAIIIIIIYAALLALLTAVPHALLLSATGTLCHSPFSYALVPVITAGVVLFSVTYGIVVRTFRSIADIADAMVHGLSSAAPLIFCYIVAMMFYHTLCYVF